MRAGLIVMCVGGLAACGGDRPPTIPPGGGGGIIISTGGTGGTPPDGGEDGGDAATDGTVANTITCTEVPSIGNGMTLIPIDFEAEIAYATFVPDACSPSRDVQFGFDTDGCGLDEGDRLTFTFDIDAVDQNLIVPFSPILIGMNNVVQVRLFTDEGARGNCFGSSGLITFQTVSNDSEGSVTANFEMQLTDCSGRNLSAVTASGGIDVVLPPDCAP